MHLHPRRKEILVTADDVMNRLEELEEVVNYCDEHGNCSKCGSCCGDLLPLTRDERRRIQRYINKHDIQEVPLEQQDVVSLMCPFLNDEGLCNIYKVRPKMCKVFQCNQDMGTIQKNKKKLHTGKDDVSMRRTFFGEQH